MKGCELIQSRLGTVVHCRESIFWRRSAYRIFLWVVLYFNLILMLIYLCLMCCLTWSLYCSLNSLYRSTILHELLLNLFFFKKPRDIFEIYLWNSILPLPYPKSWILSVFLKLFRIVFCHQCTFMKFDFHGTSIEKWGPLEKEDESLISRCG